MIDFSINTIHPRKILIIQNNPLSQAQQAFQLLFSKYVGCPGTESCQTSSSDPTISSVIEGVHAVSTDCDSSISYSLLMHSGLRHLMVCRPGPSCSKLTTSLVNVSLKFQTFISQIYQYFLLKKCEKLLQCKSFSHPFQKKIQCVWL